MATNITLDDLVEAIASAVIHAQDRVEHYQTSILKTYFNKDGRPNYIKLILPSLQEKADEELWAPELALVGRTTLAIKEIEVSTTVTLGDLSEFATRERTDTPEDQGAEKREARKAKAVRLDLGATAQAPTAATASLKLKVAAQEPTEGMARLMVELNKRIRAYPSS